MALRNGGSKWRRYDIKFRVRNIRFSTSTALILGDVIIFNNIEINSCSIYTRTRTVRKLSCLSPKRPRLNNSLTEGAQLSSMFYIYFISSRRRMRNGTRSNGGRVPVGKNPSRIRGSHPGGVWKSISKFRANSTRVLIDSYLAKCRPGQAEIPPPKGT